MLCLRLSLDKLVILVTKVGGLYFLSFLLFLDGWVDVVVIFTGKLFVVRLVIYVLFGRVFEDTFSLFFTPAVAKFDLVDCVEDVGMVSVLRVIFR